MDKRILFILFVLIGSIAVAISVTYIFGASHITEYIALFTSLSTAIYAILAQPRERTEPFLRITPRYNPNRYKSPNIAIDICVRNIGYSIARDIEVRCRLIPNGSIPLERNGIINIELLAPKESVECPLGPIKRSKLLSQKVLLVACFLDEDGKKQKPIKKEALISELEQKLRDEGILF